mmetsp:Transcript_83575/g.165872  ORF Transcript_83575/g.165872 Transcript_83575/m.165872 type:complete len:397 (-) Transcript_83575:215-1405(-)
MSCCPLDAVGYLAADHTDEGTVRSVDGISYYQIGSGPNGLLFCPDVWGWNGGRTRAIADDFAKMGVSVWVPKLLPAFEGGTDGDGLPPSYDIKNRTDLPDLFKGEWNQDKVVPKLLSVIKAMKSAGVKKIGLIGFCYGAWVGMYLAKEADLVGCASPHPSIHIEGLFERDPAEIAAESKCPWALFPAGVAADGGDSDTYDAEGALFQALESKFPGKNVTKRFESVPHGFVPRGAIKEHAAGTGDEVKKAVQECVTALCEFFVRRGLMRRDKAGLPPPPIKLRKPKFGKVGKVNPESRGLNLLLKVVKCEETEAGKTWEAVLGDDTGIVTFSLKSKDHADLCEKDSSVRVQNARVLMIKGHIRAIIDKWAVMKKADEPVEGEVKSDKDVSAVEYELA